ncbi:MAG: trigger factor [Rikenellaceae bacterium]|nr:trigger factor [Rikenellaceae bacterium]MCL2691867.1 trigger factor [Rikenellaceae bacterium]
MNIVRENREGQTALIKVTVMETDYREAVEKTLKEYRRKANVPGFRPGMTPMGMIRKMYGKGVLAEETYKQASAAAFEYIEKEKIEYVGDVMPSEEQATFDFDNATEFEFVFEIGLAPEVTVELTEKDKVTRYEIKADEKMLGHYREGMLRRFGRLEDVDVVTSDEALSVMLDNAERNIEDAYVGLISMDEAARKPFIGRKVGDVMEVNVNELYPTPSQRAAILHVKQDELDAIDPKFTLTITKIRKFVMPALDETFFTMAFPDGSVKDETSFETHIAEQIARDTRRETEHLFGLEVRRMLLDKAALPMPEDFLRRWLLAANEGKFTMEQIEADMPQFLDMMRWNLVQKYYAEKLDVKLEPQDALNEAKAYAAMQFAQYGMANVEDEMLDNYAKQILQNKDEARKIYDRLFERKVLEAVTPMLKVVNKKVMPEEFGTRARDFQPAG